LSVADSSHIGAALGRRECNGKRRGCNG
jgi:hypothetical protein